MAWRIYYSDDVVEGETEADWRDAPSQNVQVVVRFPRLLPIGWFCCAQHSRTIKDRDLWTGEDEYDCFGWGVKYGSLIDTKRYFEIWERACSDGYD